MKFGIGDVAAKSPAIDCDKTSAAWKLDLVWSLERFQIGVFSVIHVAAIQSTVIQLISDFKDMCDAALRPAGRVTSEASSNGVVHARAFSQHNLSSHSNTFGAEFMDYSFAVVIKFVSCVRFEDVASLANSNDNEPLNVDKDDTSIKLLKQSCQNHFQSVTEASALFSNS